MPYKIRKVGFRTYRVIGRSGKVHAKSTTKIKATRQVRLLRSLGK